MTQRYDTYKDSGVQWLGEIPGHWERMRLKNVMKLLNGRAYLQPELQEIGKYRILRVGNFFTNDRWYYSDMELEPDKYCNKGDLLFAWSASFGPYIWNEEKAIYHYHIWKVLMGERYDKLYAYYMFLAFSEVKRRYVHGSTMVHLTLQNMNQSYIPLPPLSEQRSIVSFLDAKCGMIDEWVTKKQKEVEHLQELKQRVIADAVTRGLNPNVSMKQTGVFWWKETPEQWQKLRLGCILQKMNRQRLPNSELLVCTNKGKVIKRGDTKIGLIADSEDIYQGVAKGDLLIHGMDTWHGAIAVSNFNGMCTPVVHVCTSNENLYFVAYYMQVMAYSKIFKIISNGVRQNTSDFRSWSKVDKIPIMLPSKHEQKQIVSYLDAKTSKIDKLIANITKEIECIKEYKQRLISDVVTGQIKVC